MESAFPAVAPSEMANRIAVGVAGWSYPDWDGYVYPPGTKDRDKLPYLAAYVDVIEINSTFYRPPDARTASSWMERVNGRSSFFFTAKIHQDITHHGKIEPAMARAFCDGLGPLIDAGRLRHLLAQFRYDFADGSETRRHLERIRIGFGGRVNLTVELRHNSWQAPDALGFLRSLGVTVANLDYPLARNSFNLQTCTVGDHAYLRLHGRNAKAWFSKGAGRDETYNYLYSDAELTQIAERAARIASLSKSLTVIANNHYQGKEAANALELKARLWGRKVAVPPALLQKYPRLSSIAEPPRGE